MHLFARIQMRRAAVAVLSLSLYPPPHSSLSLSFASNGVPRTLARFSHALQERVRVCRHFDSSLSLSLFFPSPFFFFSFVDGGFEILVFELEFRSGERIDIRERSAVGI